MAFVISSGVARQIIHDEWHSVAGRSAQHLRRPERREGLGISHRCSCNVGMRARARSPLPRSCRVPLKSHWDAFALVLSEAVATVGLPASSSATSTSFGCPTPAAAICSGPASGDKMPESTSTAQPTAGAGASNRGPRVFDPWRVCTICYGALASLDMMKKRMMQMRATPSLTP